MTKPELRLLSIIGGLLSLVVLPAAIWAFTALMETRDQVLQISADVRAIQTVLRAEVERLYQNNDNLREQLRREQQ